MVHFEFLYSKINPRKKLNDLLLYQQFKVKKKEKYIEKSMGQVSGHLNIKDSSQKKRKTKRKKRKMESSLKIYLKKRKKIFSLSSRMISAIRV